MDIQAIINEIGGARKISEAIGVSQSAVYKWVSRGCIPTWHRNLLVRSFPDKPISEWLEKLNEIVT